jgi:hypothetical protein
VVAHTESYMLMRTEATDSHLRDTVENRAAR